MPDSTEQTTPSHAPDARFQAINALVVARALTISARTGVFDALGAHARTTVDLSDTLDLDPGTLDLILRVLVGQGYIDYANGSYSLSSSGREELLPQSPNSHAAAISLGDMVWHQLESLDQVLKTGDGVDMHHSLTDEADWDNYQRAMVDGARQAARLVAAATPVRPDARQLLDVAGSHGLFGAMICREHPGMTAVVLDLPNALPAARRIAEEEGIDDVVEHREADILADDFPVTQDVVFLGNILHHFDESHVVAIIGRVKDALNLGGTIAIWENVAPEPDSPPDPFTDTSALIFRVMSSGRSYRANEYVQWLAQAGFEDAQVQPLVPGSTLITARVTS